MPKELRDRPAATVGTVRRDTAPNDARSPRTASKAAVPVEGRAPNDARSLSGARAGGLVQRAEQKTDDKKERRGVRERDLADRTKAASESLGIRRLKLVG
jgi:hypothetical protein